MIPKALQALAADVERLTAELRKRLTRYLSTRADQEAKIARLRAENEGLDLSPAEHIDKILRELIAKVSTARELATGDARYRLEPLIGKLDAELRTFTHEARSAVLTEDDFDGYRQSDMLTMVVARELLRTRIDQMNVDDLLSEYRHAIAHRSPDGALNRRAEAAITMELIEHRVGRGKQSITQGADQLPAFRQLTTLIAEQQESRLPAADVEDIADIVTDARAAITAAERAGILPINLALDAQRRKLAEPELAELVEA